MTSSFRDFACKVINLFWPSNVHTHRHTLRGSRQRGWHTQKKRRTKKKNKVSGARGAQKLVVLFGGSKLPPPVSASAQHSTVHNRWRWFSIGRKIHWHVVCCCCCKASSQIPIMWRYVIQEEERGNAVYRFVGRLYSLDDHKRRLQLNTNYTRAVGCCLLLLIWEERRWTSCEFCVLCLLVRRRENKIKK